MEVVVFCWGGVSFFVFFRKGKGVATLREG